MQLSKKKKKQNEKSFENFPPIGGLMVSKMIVEGNMKPRFMYREKGICAEDSGWRIFSGYEPEGYVDDPQNIKIYSPSTILKIDSSIEKILLTGVGSAYERVDEQINWQKITDFELEDDYMVTHQLSDKWSININNLFERIEEKNGHLLYTTGDKSVRLFICNEQDRTKEEIYQERIQFIKDRDQSVAKTLNTFDFSDNQVLKVGYMINERDNHKTYQVIYGSSIIDQQFLMLALYFDDKKDIDWAIETWESIKASE
ncbi:MAG: DUF2185 domain-containing protein [Sphingobacteriaceae bacterium]|nr:DUF2185 domain-containing protein [Sphingobacteriaceae bacterium]